VRKLPTIKIVRWVPGITCDFSANKPVCQKIRSGECYQPVVVAAAFYHSANAQWSTDEDDNGQSDYNYRALIIAVGVGLPLALALCIVVAVATVKPLRNYFFPGGGIVFVSRAPQDKDEEEGGVQKL